MCSLLCADYTHSCRESGTGVHWALELEWMKCEKAKPGCLDKMHLHRICNQAFYSVLLKTEYGMLRGSPILLLCHLNNGQMIAVTTEATKPS